MYEIFKNLLEEKHMKVAEFSRISNISQSTLSDWKNGRSTPKADKMQIIADTLGVSVKYLMTGKNEENHNLPKYDSRIHNMISDFGVIEENKKQTIYNLLSDMADYEYHLQNSREYYKSKIRDMIDVYNYFYMIYSDLQDVKLTASHFMEQIQHAINNNNYPEDEDCRYVSVDELEEISYALQKSYEICNAIQEFTISKQKMVKNYQELSMPSEMK